MARKFTFSLEYVENNERLIAAKASNEYNIVSPVLGQYGSNLGSLWPLGGDIKEWKVASGYQGIEPRTLGCHARTLTTVPPPAQ